ncbi:hypothetical protein [Actinophytocola oryzae]|uniref:hypothetical protein n=1 Tax=Actinophytocola oryzae TaxID=502181 RepID=UPI001FB98073|nr:hypothetical protein [Actinophytocola oryzae]
MIGPTKFTAITNAHNGFRPRTAAIGRRARSVHAVAASPTCMANMPANAQR